jgi:hypothetical protein
VVIGEMQIMPPAKNHRALHPSGAVNLFYTGAMAVGRQLHFPDKQVDRAGGGLRLWGLIHGGHGAVQRLQGGVCGDDLRSRVNLFGPWLGDLPNVAERVSLEKPSRPICRTIRRSVDRRLR